jgi:hypothetical protein
LEELLLVEILILMVLLEEVLLVWVELLEVILDLEFIIQLMQEDGHICKKILVMII